MYLVIVKKVEGRWIIDIDSNHIFEGSDGVFVDGAYQEVEVAQITPIKKHPNDPSADD